MKEYEIKIDDSTASLLEAIAKADDDPLVIATLAEVNVDEFRQFMTECGEDSSAAVELLKAAELLEQSKLSRQQQLYRPTAHKSQIPPGLIYLLIGGGIGAILALLFAPKSGKDLRRDIADMSGRGLDRSEEKLIDRAQEVARRAMSQTMTGEWDASETGQKVYDKEKRKTEGSGGGLGVVPKLDERSR